MPPPDPPTRAVLHLSLFSLASLGWMVVLSTVMMAMAGTQDPARLIDALGPGLLGWITMVQIAGLAVLAVVASRRLPDPAPLASALALTPTSWVWVPVAIVGGATVWMLPSWIASTLAERMSSPSAMEIIGESLSGPLLETWPLVFAVVGVAPIAEEIVFRGHLWNVIARSAPRSIAWIGTSALFLIYHLDLLQMVALVPTALFLGWLRLASRSVGPSILAHLTHNALGVGIAMYVPPDTPITAVSALVGLNLTLVACAAGTWIDRGQR